MRPFDFVETNKLDEACNEAAKPGAMIKAGGIDLLDRLKERVEPDLKTVVSIQPLRPELAKVETVDGAVHMGSLLTIDQVEHTTELDNQAFAAVTEAARSTATPPIRRRATLGGNLLQKSRCWYLRSSGFGCLHGGDGDACMALAGENRYHSVMGYDDCVRVHPSNMAPALLAVDAKVAIQGRNGSRTVPLSEVFPANANAANAEHTLAADEVLAHVILETPPAGTRSAYCESREKESHDWATTSAAVSLQITDGVIRNPRICLGAVAPVPVPSPDAAKLLDGQAPDKELFAKVAEAAYEGALALMQNGYKVQVGKTMLIDALTQAAGME